ncbi:senescence-associated protein-domain-containing protein [Helicostylum pulchrum]|nr:senescence-associated protein-domain-containing protein [Helicostylum pulchrum]
MAILPITPSSDQIDPSTLTYLCLVDRVSVSSFDEGILTLIGEGHLVAYITSDPTADQQLLLLRFFDFYDEEKCTIVLVSRSKAWLQDERTLIFPRAQGGLWRVDCSDSDEVTFSELQDVLTYFIKYENRHQMKNTLAMVNPASCEITQVVAGNVRLDRSDAESILNEEDFISHQEAERGQKLPVYVGNSNFENDPTKIRNVRLLYQSGSAMVTGSDWIAHGLVLAGQALAKGITNGGKMLEDRIAPTQEPMRLSDEERRAFEVVYNTTSSVSQMAAGLVDMAVTSAVSGINSMVYDNDQMKTREPVENAQRHFGMSALQAVAKIAGGVASAASSVLGSSRDSLIQVVNKKYGQDAGYIAQRAIGAGANVADMLVYFDARGISRRVVFSGAGKVSNSQAKTEELDDVADQPNRSEVVFENDWLEDQLNQGKNDSSSTVKDDKTIITI